MNPDWDTPPGGDFARYVEQLTARSVRQLQVASMASPSIAEAPGAVAAQRVARAKAQGQVEPVTPGADPAKSRGDDSAMRGFARSLAIGWAALLLVLMIMGATGAALGVFAAGVWGAFQMRRWLLPEGGAQGLKAALENLA